jgi:hypothetical protein
MHKKQQQQQQQQLNSGAPQGAPFGFFRWLNGHTFAHRLQSMSPCHIVFSGTVNQVQLCGHLGQKGQQEGFFSQPSLMYSTFIKAAMLHGYDAQFLHFVTITIVYGLEFDTVKLR